MAFKALRLPLTLASITSSASPVIWNRAQIGGSLRCFSAMKAAKLHLPRKKRRLDEVCLERYQQYSRTFIQSWIMQGKVRVDGKVVNKAGTPVPDKSVIEIIADVPKYVCRAGFKLEAAIEQLGVDVEGKVALDSGLSTGGFTDCLLQFGASFVYGVDVGYGQVADKIRRDERVSVIERTNLRYLTDLPQKVDLVTLDLSFISILLVMPAVVKAMKEEATLITLVKPQFEARRSQVGGGGIVRDPLVHQEVLEKIISGVESYGFQNKGWIESPLKGAEGNTEFLVRFDRMADTASIDRITTTIAAPNDEPASPPPEHADPDLGGSNCDELSNGEGNVVVVGIRRSKESGKARTESKCGYFGIQPGALGGCDADLE